jgi:hypothetical protein
METENQSQAEQQLLPDVQEVDTRDASGDLDSGFFCDLVGVTTTFATPNTSKSDPAVSHDDVPNQLTKIPAHKQGFTKVILLGALVSIPSALLGWMMFGGSGTQTQLAKASEVELKPAPKNEFTSDPRFGVVQSKLAMQKQEQDLLAAAKTAQSPSAKMATVPAADVKVIPTTADSAAPSPTPVNVASNLSAVSSPPTNVLPPLLPPAITPVLSPTKRSVPVKVIATKTVVKSSIQPTLAANRSLIPKLVTPQAIRSTPTIGRVLKPSSPPVTWQQASDGAVGVFGSRTESTVAQSNQSAGSLPGRTIIAGQNRTVSLVAPLQILAGEPAQEILLNVDRGFVDTQGEISIPANTKILAQVTVASNGMLRIGSARALLGGSESAINAGNFMLAATNNTPLFAELKQFGQGDIARRDMQTFMLGAAQGLGRILTQPDTQTQITTSGAAISTTTNRQNILGGILEGGASPIIQQWAQRNQAEIQRLEGSTRLWFLPAGFKMSLFTIKPFEIN